MITANVCSDSCFRICCHLLTYLLTCEQTAVCRAYISIAVCQAAISNTSVVYRRSRAPFVTRFAGCQMFFNFCIVVAYISRSNVDCTGDFDVTRVVARRRMFHAVRCSTHFERRAGHDLCPAVTMSTTRWSKVDQLLRVVLHCAGVRLGQLLCTRRIDARTASVFSRRCDFEVDV